MKEFALKLDKGHIASIAVAVDHHQRRRHTYEVGTAKQVIDRCQWGGIWGEE